MRSQVLSLGCWSNCNPESTFCWLLMPDWILEARLQCQDRGTSGYGRKGPFFFLQARLTNLFRFSFCQVCTSREFKCCGAVGGLSYAPEILKGHHCGSDESELRPSSSFDTRSLGKKGPCVAETEIGEGNTCQWVWMAQHSKGGVVSIYFLHVEGSTWTLDTGAKVVGSLDRNTTIGFYFDIANQQVPSLLEWGMGKDFVWKTDFDREIVPQKMALYLNRLI